MRRGLFRPDNTLLRRSRSPVDCDETPPSSPQSFTERNSLSQRKPWRGLPEQDDEADMADVEEHDLTDGAGSSADESSLEGELQCACGRCGRAPVFSIPDPVLLKSRQLSVSVSLRPSELKSSTMTTTSTEALMSLSQIGLAPQLQSPSSMSSTSVSPTSSRGSLRPYGAITPSVARVSSSSELKSSTPSTLALPSSPLMPVSTACFNPTKSGSLFSSLRPASKLAVSIQSPPTSSA